MFPKTPAHSKIRKIVFCENHPNPSGGYVGSWWIISFDADGRQIVEDGLGVGNAEFPWRQKELAVAWLRRLRSFCEDAEVIHIVKKDAKSIHGIMSFREN